jgi:hypothetical protein
MKFDCIQKGRTGGEHGSAVVLFIALLAIMVILASGNNRALFDLHREIKTVEQQQIERLAASQTNSIAITKLESK